MEFYPSGGPYQPTFDQYGNSTSHPRLRADGNLTYLEFIRLIESLWIDVTGYRDAEEGCPPVPLIPFRAEYTGLSDPTYPVIVYSLEMRKTFTNEPKPRYREPIHQEDGTLIVQGQRFQNVIKFTVYDQVMPDGAHQAEEIIERFEDFMLECAPVFKRLGLSDIFYGRRYGDDAASRPAINITGRSISYEVITEKIIVTDWWRLREIEGSIRVFLENNAEEAATPSFVPIHIVDEQQSITSD